MTNRREFIKSAGRILLLVLIGLTAVWGFRKKKISTEARAACAVNPDCRGCEKFDKCKTEQAEEFRGER